MRLLCIARDCTEWNSGTPERLSAHGWWQKAGEQGLCPTHAKDDRVAMEPPHAAAKKKFPKPGPRQAKRPKGGR